MKALLVGCGKMGGYHLNSIRAAESIESVSVVEPHRLSRDLLQNETHFLSLRECIDSGYHDLAVVASPTSTHVDAAEMILNSGTKVLIEKPISDSVISARRLKKYSDLLAVGHIERFNPVVESLADILKNRRIDSCSFFRLSSFPNRITDVGVDLDLSIHDLDLSIHILGSACVVDRDKRLDDLGRVVDAKYLLDCNGVPVTIHSSWLHKSVDRKIVVESEGDLIVGDLVSKQVFINNRLLDLPNLDSSDQITKQLFSFLNFVRGEDTKICRYTEAVSVLELV